MSGGCSCPTVVCPPSPPRCGGGSSAGCGGGSCGGGCGGTSGGCGSSGNCGGGSSGGCVATNCDNGYGGCSSGCVGSSGCSGCSGSSSGCGGSSSYGGSSVGCGGSSGCSGSSSGCGGSHGTYPSPSTGCAPSSARLTIECSKETTTGGCGNTINCLPQEQKPSSGYAKGNSGGGGYTNTGQQPTSGCSSENCSPVHPQQQQTSQQNNPSYNAPPPLPPQNYVAPSLPTAECQSATPNECNILPQSSNQPTWSSGAGGTYAQKNTEGDRELLQNKGEGFSSSGNSGFGQGNYESIQTSTFPSPPLTTYNQQQQIPEHQPVQPPPIVEPALPPLPPTDDYLTSLSPETETTTGGEEENKENYKRDPPSINVSGGKINGGPNMQGNKLASAKIPATKTNFENSFPMDLYGDDELALADYDDELDLKTSTTTSTLKTTTKALETTTSKKVFAVVPPEKATTASSDDKDDILTNDYSENSFKKVHASPHSSDKLYSKLGTGNSKCSSETLRTIMHENIVVSPTISKQLIFSAGRLTFGASIDVICSRNRFSYTVISSKIFCETSRGPVTCFAFLQP